MHDTACLVTETGACAIAPRAERKPKKDAET
jgi:hypothetical protein